MKRKVLFLALLVGAALAPHNLFATTCQQSYQFCLSQCAVGDTACRLNCLDIYNACRHF